MTPHDYELNRPLTRTNSPGSRGWLGALARVAWVRLRFVIVLLVAFLVIGQWSALRTYWDAAWHRLAGTATAEQGVANEIEYFCPMDPGVLSDWPAICPVCNMDLQRRKRGDAQILPEGVVARMQLAPFRIQLAGIHTTVVEPRHLAREIRLAGRLALEAGSAGRFVLDCDVWQGDVPFLTPGSRADVAIEGIPGAERIPAMIVDPPRSNDDLRDGPAVVVRFAFESGGLPLRAGQFARVSVEAPLADAELQRAPTGSGDEPAGILAVPESAVVRTGQRRLVYVETMPGMFDGVEVELGPRCGDFFPVRSGLLAGQRVATAGAFLIDAEARLNPALAAGYFGAARSGGASASAAAPLSNQAETRSFRRVRTKGKPGSPGLSAADQSLAARQKTCPVTDLPLDSMGGPVAIEISGRKVFLCCAGCESRVRKEPEKYLAKLTPPE